MTRPTNPEYWIIVSKVARVFKSCTTLIQFESALCYWKLAWKHYLKESVVDCAGYKWLTPRAKEVKNYISGVKTSTKTRLMKGN